MECGALGLFDGAVLAPIKLNCRKLVLRKGSQYNKDAGTEMYKCFVGNVQSISKEI